MDFFHTWRHWPHDKCLHCGNDAEIYTDAPKGQACEDDVARCTACGCPGSVVIDDFGEESATASVSWHDEPGCRCTWCRAHYTETGEWLPLPADGEA